MRVNRLLPIISRRTLAAQRFSSQSIAPPKQGHSFHKRPLPANLIALSSKEGKRLFRETLDDGHMENYFPLAEQFITQSEPSYCSLSSLAMVLNALNFDPKKIWKGSWRWVSEETLYCESKAVCGHSEEKIKTEGLSFLEFESLARCHGVNIQSFRACHSTSQECGSRGFQQFYNKILDITSNPKSDQFMVINFSRKQLGQTGDGHYSPIAALHRASGYVLILDVARFKYPPYWVKVEEMWNAMAVEDKTSGQSRGYFLVTGYVNDNLNEKNSVNNQHLEHMSAALAVASCSTPVAAAASEKTTCCVHHSDKKVVSAV